MYPLLTIVIPVYNVEKYLKECLDSVINQIYKELEIIIVNDCSPANEEKIIFEYMKVDSRIKYIKHQKNLGLGGARNTGINHATGKYITFVDSDDWIELNTYSNVLEKMIQHRSNLGIFSVNPFNDDGSYLAVDTYFNAPESAQILVHCNAMAWNKIFLLEDLIENKLMFPEYLKHEDEAFWAKYLMSVKVSVVTDMAKYYHYRLRKGSIMSMSDRSDLPLILLDVYNYKMQSSQEISYYQEILIKLFIFINDNLKNLVLVTNLYNVLKSIQLTQEELDVLPMAIQESYQYINTSENLRWFQIISLLETIKDGNQQINNLQDMIRDKNQQINNLQDMIRDKNQQIDHLLHDKWYRFGQKSKFNKIKAIIKFLLKKLRVI